MAPKEFAKTGLGGRAGPVGGRGGQGLGRGHGTRGVKNWVTLLDLCESRRSQNREARGRFLWQVALVEISHTV